ncbi:MAG: GDP-fucose synthetase, partial [Verrucomicrobia bacterium]
PDGTPRKLLDVTKLRALGWKPAITLRNGVASTYEWFRANCVK